MSDKHECDEPGCDVCSGKSTPKDLLDKARADVEECGWSCVGVMQDHGKPFHAYTIGLQERCNHSELVIVGLTPAHISHAVLTPICRDIAAGALVVRDGELLSGYLTDDYNLKAVSVEIPEDQMQYWFGFCLNYYGYHEGEPVPHFFQLLWPDAENKFPGDDGYANLTFGTYQFSLSSLEGLLRTGEIMAREDAKIR